MASIIEIVDEEDYSGLNEEVKHKRTAKRENVGQRRKCWSQPIVLASANPIFITRSVT